MIKSLAGHQGMSVGAADGDVGTVAGFLVDLDHWLVRHVAVNVNAGNTLGAHEVLISPELVTSPPEIGDSTEGGYDLMVSTTRDQVLHAGNTGGAPHIVTPRIQRVDPQGAVAVLVEPIQSGLVDSREIFGTHIEAVGGPMGHLDDLLVEEDTWRVRYVVVDPKNWWLGKHVLISPEWIERFDWPHNKVHVSVEREAIKSAPEYDAGYVLTREDEAAVFRHYKRRPYWPD